MGMPCRAERMAARRDQATRIRVQCPAVDTPMRRLILEQATIYADGWARWTEDGRVSVGYVQVGPSCDPPAVNEASTGALRRDNTRGG